MGKGTKVWLITAVSLVIVGLAVCLAAMIESDWDFSKLSTTQFETNTHVISEAFSNLSVDTDTADIFFALSDNGKCRVECFEQIKAKHSVAVQEDTLVIGAVNEKAWYDYIGIHFRTPKVTVYLPQGEYEALFIKESTGDITIPKNFQFALVDISLSTGDVRCGASATGEVKIQTSTGEIWVEAASAGALKLSASTGGITVRNVTCQGDVELRVSTGKTKLENLMCQNLAATADTGDISLNRVVAEGRFGIHTNTGNVRFGYSDAAEILVETNTGAVTGTLLTEKIFLVETDTGRIEVPKSTTGGRCEIKTDTGDIKLDIA